MTRARDRAPLRWRPLPPLPPFHPNTRDLRSPNALSKCAGGFPWYLDRAADATDQQRVCARAYLHWRLPPATPANPHRHTAATQPLRALQTCGGSPSTSRRRRGRNMPVDVPYAGAVPLATLITCSRHLTPPSGRYPAPHMFSKRAGDLPQRLDAAGDA